MAAVVGSSTEAFEAGVTGINTNSTPEAGVGVHGKSSAAGVLGENNGGWHGVAGIGGQSGGEGVSGESRSTWAGVGGYNKGPDGGPGVWGVGGATGGEGVHGESQSTWAGVGGYNKGPDGGPGVWGVGGATGGEGVHGESQSTWAGVGGYNKSPDGGPGVWGVGGATGGEGVHGESQSSWAGVGGYNKSPDGGPGVWGVGGATGGEGVHGESQSSWAGVGGYNKNNGPGVWGIGGPNGGEGVHGESHSTWAAVAGYSKSTGAAGFFEGDVIVREGDLILEGADYAEALTTTDPNVVAGTVVVLADDGELHPCQREYDSAVAGIVSGAKGVKPAIVLDRHSNSAPVALLGKVWCRADASTAAIRPGDLLTTSATPGHCRRVTDNVRAFGAVIGKALTPLADGRGLVRVLVSPR